MRAADRTYIITIDGPAASGKSSVSRELARQRGWSWVSTGAFYRGLAFVAQSTKNSLESEDDLVKLATGKDWSVEMGVERTIVRFQGKDVTDQIHREDVGVAASKISHYPKVRQTLLQAQRDCAKGGKSLVAEGRDCGTVVFPQADLKIYLTAKSENRAARRAREEGGSVAETQAKQNTRDLQDSSRQSAPLQVPDQAHIVDTSDMDLPAVVEHINALLKERLKI